MDMPTQEASAEAVERGYPRTLCAAKPLHPLLHFLRGLVGEGDREQALCRVALVNQVSHPVGDRAGLATARTREDEEGANLVENSFTLGGVEGTENEVGVQFSAHRLRILGNP